MLLYHLNRPLLHLTPPLTFTQCLVALSLEGVCYIPLASRRCPRLAQKPQAALLVGALGLQDAWTGDMSKMGSIMFLDGKSKAVLASTLQSDVMKHSPSIM